MNLPKNIENAVVEHKIVLGMTEEQVKLSWGKPERINRTVTRRGEREQWIYGDTYLYFENGVLDAWQDRK
jgi:hypothetical protein